MVYNGDRFCMLFLVFLGQMFFMVTMLKLFSTCDEFSARYSVRKGSTRNFMQKNRQAVSRNHGVTNNLSSCGNYPLNTFGGGTAPPRTKIGQVPKIGDALGTPSNKGSSSFMSAGHNGVRDATLKSGYMKRGF